MPLGLDPPQLNQNAQKIRHTNLFVASIINLVSITYTNNHPGCLYCLGTNSKKADITAFICVDWVIHAEIQHGICLFWPREVTHLSSYLDLILVKNQDDKYKNNEMDICVQTHNRAASGKRSQKYLV